MSQRFAENDTVCAIATPLGTGGISVLRVSGPRAVEIVRHLCRFLPETPESHRVYFGTLRDLESSDPIDEVVLTVFGEGRSYTGEETVEVSCHGGRFITDHILKELVAAGARLARPGEFTFRAFMNGRLDLVQAESVLSLIESQNRASARQAVRQLKGELSSTLAGFEERLVRILAHLEANIDFASEDIVFRAPRELLAEAEALRAEIDALLATYEAGRMVDQGVAVALVGAPNAGKSSLLNFLAGFERAIVTPVPGTTRDVVEARRLVAGLDVVFSDTAGLRETGDEVERLGIERGLKVAREADYVFLVVDAADSSAVDPRTAELDPERTFLVINKTDLIEDFDLGTWMRRASNGVLPLLQKIPQERCLGVSVKEGRGLAELVGALESELDNLAVEGRSCLSQARHFELLSGMSKGLAAAAALMRIDESPDLAVFELQEALWAIHEILGKRFDDQVLDRVFQEFCLGK